MADIALNVLTGLYVLATLWLAVYGLNSLILVIIYWLRGRSLPSSMCVDREQLPAVTVQLPLYNEKHVAERLIDVVAALDYPRDRLQIQILDDSTDETGQLVDARAALYQEQGLDLQVLRRANREGFKAGALALGLTQAKGEFIAIFDADFCPYSDFLLCTIPHLMSSPDLGMVQARWCHLNSDYSPLTRLQALALDGHFVVEQPARSCSQLLMHFNGTAGVWRRACIEESGGWQSDTLCEDLDLSYRAQLEGWRFRYLREVEAPSELPPQILAFKRQQARWAQGSTQCLRKLTLPLARASNLSIVQKIMGMFHLTGYFGYPLMVLLLLLSLPLLLRPGAVGGALRFLAPLFLGPMLVYVTSQWVIYPDWKSRLLNLPLMVLVGTGVAWSNTLAVWRGLWNWGGEMLRTPKFHIEGRTGHWGDSNYRMSADRAVVGEVMLTLYAVIAVVTALMTGNLGSVPFLVLCALAFGVVGALSLVEVWQGRRASVSRLPEEHLSGAGAGLEHEWGRE